MTQNEERGPGPRRRSATRDFFGGSPLAVIVRLLVLSLVVGLLMSWLGLSPVDLFRSLERAVRETWANSGALLQTALAYILTGAAVVVPIWLVLRLLRMGRGR